MLSTVFFPELLTAFQKEYPDVPVMLEEYASVRACNLVQNDSLDLALVNMEQYNIDKFHHALLDVYKRQGSGCTVQSGSAPGSVPYSPCLLYTSSPV